MSDWKDRFVDLLSKHDRASATSLKQLNLPISVFKYFAVEEDRGFEALRTSTLWLVSPLRFNDLYDSSLSIDVRRVVNAVLPKALPDLRAVVPTLDTLISLEELAAVQNAQDVLKSYKALLVRKDLGYLATTLDKMLYHEWSEQAQRKLDTGVRQRLRISCFSTRVNSMPMWYHYASGYEGFCVEYVVNEMTENGRQHLYPVIYAAKRPVLETLLGVDDSTDERMCPVILDAIHKAPDWSYEEEWRLVDLDADMQQDHFELSMPHPVGIYMGERIKPHDAERVRDVRNELVRQSGIGIPLYKMGCSNIDYDMVPSVQRPHLTCESKGLTIDLWLNATTA